MTFKISSGSTNSAGGPRPAPAAALAHLVFAHGAGAGMHHPWMQAMAEALFAANVASSRYNFPYMQAGKGPPDRPPVLMQTVRAQVTNAYQRTPNLPLLAGGKSMGGRMTAYAQAETPLPHVRGLVLFCFPLHPPNRIGTERAAPLARVDIPMLFLQGTRDKLADITRMRQVCSDLGQRATLVEIDQADHAFMVPKRVSRDPGWVVQQLAEAVRSWVESTV